MVHNWIKTDRVVKDFRAFSLTAHGLASYISILHGHLIVWLNAITDLKTLLLSMLSVTFMHNVPISCKRLRVILTLLF